MLKINNFLAGWKMTLVSGVFLVFSFVLPRIGITLPVDPAWATVFISGIPLVYLAVWRIIHNPGVSKISSALLITIAMIAAIMIEDLFAAGEVAFIMAIGALLEETTARRAKKGLRKLIGIAPAQGRRIAEGKEEMIAAEQIQKGDILRVLPGESIPVDGVILAGMSSIDQSVMTGESLPVDKGVEDEVFCGTINCFGSIDIKATKVGEDSSLQRLIHIVQEAESKQASTQRIADKWASLLVPVAMTIAVIAGFATRNIVTAVTVLVVFCPCALVLATPTAIMAAIGQATKHGVIIKSGEALEKMGKVNKIAFDKTGTLTRGCLEVSDIISLSPDLDESTLLSLAASAESRSEHPLGKAVVSYAKERHAKLTEPEVFRMEAGKGVYAKVGGHNLFCGNKKYLCENGICIAEQDGVKIEELTEQGKAIVLIASGEVCIGAIALSDALRPNAGQMVRELTKMGVASTLLTGDNRRTADYFSKEADVTEVYAGLLPEEKLGRIETLQSTGKIVCMIGDGVNDAPALKTANVGVAMGGMGSDIAVDAADITLMGDDLSKIPYLKWLSNETVSTIKLSITLSMCINFLAVTLSVMGLLTPTTGALVHNAGSCFVVLIAALLYDRKYKHQVS